MKNHETSEGSWEVPDFKYVSKWFEKAVRHGVVPETPIAAWHRGWLLFFDGMNVMTRTMSSKGRWPKFIRKFKNQPAKLHETARSTTSLARPLVLNLLILKGFLETNRSCRKVNIAWKFLESRLSLQALGCFMSFSSYFDGKDVAVHPVISDLQRVFVYIWEDLRAEPSLQVAKIQGLAVAEARGKARDLNPFSLKKWIVILPNFSICLEDFKPRNAGAQQSRCRVTVGQGCHPKGAQTWDHFCRRKNSFFSMAISSNTWILHLLTCFFFKRYLRP